MKGLWILSVLERPSVEHPEELETVDGEKDVCFPHKPLSTRRHSNYLWKEHIPLTFKKYSFGPPPPLLEKPLKSLATMTQQQISGFDTQPTIWFIKDTWAKTGELLPYFCFYSQYDVTQNELWFNRLRVNVRKEFKSFHMANVLLCINKTKQVLF